MLEEHLNANRDLWDNLARVHIASKFYDLEAFISGKSSLNSVVLDLLGPVAGKSILHLQCHFGSRIPNHKINSRPQSPCRSRNDSQLSPRTLSTAFTATPRIYAKLLNVETRPCGPHLPKIRNLVRKKEIAKIYLKALKI